MAGGLGPRQQQRPGGGDLAQERVGVEGPVQQDEHARAQQRQQPPGHGGLVPVGGRAERGAEQAAGAGLGQGHQPQRRIPGEAHPVPDPAQPAAVAAGVGDLERVAARRRRPCAARRTAPPACAAGPAARRPPRTAPSAVPGRAGGAGPAAPSPTGTAPARPASPAVSLAQTRGIAQPREQPQRQHEVHPDPRRQIAQPPLHRPGLLQDVIDQLERQVLRQLAQMTRGEHPRGDGDGAGDRGRGRLRTQRDLWCPGRS